MGITPAQFPASGQRAGGEPERELSLPMDILKESYHSHPLAQMGVDKPLPPLYNTKVIAGWNSLVVQRSHKPQVVGSNPTPAPSPNGGMVDTADLESAALKSVEVRVFFWALGSKNCGISKRPCFL